MLFPTTVFAIFFLTVFALHWLLPQRSLARKIVLLCASLFFYGWWSWKFALMLFCSALLNHAAARLIASREDEKARARLLGWTVAANLGVLAFFKYTSFFFTKCFVPLAIPVCNAFGAQEALISLQESVFPLLDRIVLPVGISFYTFQALSYVVDVRRRIIAPAPSWLDFANYLAFFPQLVAGPIVRASDLLPQMIQMPRRDSARIDTGRALCIILCGLFKKVVVANWIAIVLVDPFFENPARFGTVDAFLGVYGYAVQIYCDFSAYSDIATGCAILLGFRFLDNFNAPYFSTSLQDFWRRWHISLSSWLRDYLYIPLGGSRCGTFKTYRNLILTMLLGGLWHGAGWAFVLWGAMLGGYLAVERALSRVWPALTRQKTRFGKACGLLWTFHYVCLSWILFRSGSVIGAQMQTVSGVFKAFGSPQIAARNLSLVALVMLATGFCLQFMDGERPRRIWQTVNRLPAWLQGVLAALFLTLIFGLGPQGVAPFIYFQF